MQKKQFNWKVITKERSEIPASFVEANVTYEIQSSIYCDFIPISAILFGKFNTFYKTNYVPKNKEGKITLTDTLLDSYLIELEKENAYESLNKTCIELLEEKEPFNIGLTSKYIYNSDYISVEKLTEVGEFNSRSYSSIIGLPLITVDKKIVAITCVLPENYESVIVELLLKGTINTEYLFTLIDKDILSTSFYQKNFRKMFMSKIKSKLESNNINTYYVPYDFINKNISLTKLENKGTLQNRKNKLIDVANEFINEYR